jgi:outer membrane protein assembly factor BamB
MYKVILNCSIICLLIIDLKISCLANKSSPPQDSLLAPHFIKKGPTNESTIIRLPSGVVKIFFINRPGKADKMMSIASSDEGMNWSEPTEEFTLPGEAYYANQVMVDHNGTLHCIFHLYSNGKLGYRGRQLDLWYASKPAIGGWTQPKKIWDGYVGSIRGFLELKNGTFLIPMSESDTARANRPIDGSIDYGLFQVITLRSEDGGKSWQKSNLPIKIPIESTQVTRYGAVEPHAIELKDGRIWILIRTNKGHLYETFSSDGGRTWNEALPSAFVSSDSPASMVRLSNGKIVLFWNCDQRHDDPRSYANGGREALHAAISNDDGRTWKGYREVLKSAETTAKPRGDRGTAYPSAIEMRNGKILLVSGQGEDPSIISFNAAWLEEDGFRMNYPVELKERFPLNLNFPMTKTGRLSFVVTIDKGCGPLNLALTDHFSASLDSMASRVSPFFLQIPYCNAENEKLHIQINWNLVLKKIEVELNGKKYSELSLKEKAPVGFNYLRLNRTNNDGTASPLVVDSIEMKLSHPNTRF